jgi:hypothetical protein
MFKLDVRLSLVVIAFVPVPPLIGAWAAREQTHRERTLMERWASLLSRLNEVLSGMLLVKSCAMEEEEKNAFLDGVERANEVAISGGVRDAGSNAAKGVAMTVARVGALALGSWFIVRGEMTVGTLVAFLTYAGGVFAPVQGITGAYQKFRRGMVSAETVASILEEPESLDDAPDARTAAALRGEVEFAHVYFAYHKGHPVLEDVSLHAPAGETIAIVGESGSGKSTAWTSGSTSSARCAARSRPSSRTPRHSAARYARTSPSGTRRRRRETSSARHEPPTCTSSSGGCPMDTRRGSASAEVASPPDSDSESPWPALSSAIRPSSSSRSR